MAHRLSDSTNQVKALSKIADVSRSTVQRALSEKAGISLDVLEALATALDVLPYQMLLPDLDPLNPQIVPALTERERALYDRLIKQIR